MPNWLYAFFRFVADWGRTVLSLSTAIKLVTKAVTLLVLFGVVLAANQPVRFVYFPNGTYPVEEFAFVKEATLGQVCFALAAFLFLSATFGVTWVRFRVLRFPEEVERNRNRYQLLVRNVGIAPREVTARIEEVVGAPGASESLNPDLPRELTWTCQNERNKWKSPTLSYGASEKLILVDKIEHSLRHVSEGVSQYDWVSAKFPTALGDLLLGRFHTGVIEPKNPLWFRVSFNDSAISLWFSIQAVGPNSDDLLIRREMPPHLRMGWLRKQFTKMRR